MPHIGPANTPIIKTHSGWRVPGWIDKRADTTQDQVDNKWIAIAPWGPSDILDPGWKIVVSLPVKLLVAIHFISMRERGVAGK